MKLSHWAKKQGIQYLAAWKNSDLNASSNIRLNLREIGKKERLINKNRTGFYWNELSHEPIVRDVQRDKR